MASGRRGRPGGPTRAARVALAGVVLAVSPLAGQIAPGAIAGVVTEADGGRPVAGASVFVAGTLLRAVTGGDGAYTISGLAPGRYTVSVALIGYESARAAADVAPGERARLDFTLHRALIQVAGVVVTASRAEERPGDTPASVAVLTSHAIAQRNVITLDQALPFVPGVIFNNGAIDIRGASGVSGGVGSRVLMLLDGHPVLTGDGGEVDFNALPILDVDRVEVVKGAYSAVYGSNALGGVVNVITSPIARDPETTVAAHLGGYDTPDDVRFTSEDRLIEGLDVQRSQRFGEVGTRFLVARETSDGFKQNGWMSRWLLRSKLTWPADDPQGSSAYVLWSGEDDGEFFTWRSDSEPYAVDTAAVGDWSRSRKLMLGATLHPLRPGAASFELDPYVFYNSIQNHFHDNHDYHHATRLGGNAQLALTPWRSHALTLGTDWAHTWVGSNFLGDRELWDGAFYAQDEAAFSERWSGSFGARADYHDALHERPEYALSPKFGVVFKPAGDVSTRASLGWGYRAPSAIEQFVNTMQEGYRVVPNDSLVGETAWSGEVGATTTALGRLWLDGALFWSQYRDLIAPEPVYIDTVINGQPTQMLAFQFQNVQRARVRGADVGAKLGVVGGLLEVEATYTYLDTKDLDTSAPLPYRSRHNVTGTVNGLGGLVGVDVRYRSRVEQVLAYPLDPRGAITVVDLRLAYRLFGTVLQAKVSNLFQAAYVDVMEKSRGAPRGLLVTAYRAM